MNKIKSTVKKFFTKQADDQAKGAQRAMLEELFNDFWMERRKIYQMNFYRGIFFGFGSVIGGTVVVAIIIWVLSLFGQVPLLNDYANDAQDTLQGTQRK